MSLSCAKCQVLQCTFKGQIAIGRPHAGPPIFDLESGPHRMEGLPPAGSVRSAPAGAWAAGLEDTRSDLAPRMVCANELQLHSAGGRAG